MKITINNYEIEIKAKYKHSSRANVRDTMAILNQLSIWAGESGYRYRENGCHALERGAFKARDAIYDALEAKGYYDGID